MIDVNGVPSHHKRANKHTRYRAEGKGAAEKCGRDRGGKDILEIVGGTDCDS